MKIPKHLRHLRTDRRGLPVPYINRWGGENVDTLSIAYDPHVGRPALFLDDSAETVPDFTAQNQQRQRECMVRGLCQVCATSIPWHARYLVIAALSVEHITLHGDIQLAVTEPWLCGDCATFATKTCPALIRRRRDEQLELLHITRPAQVTFVMSTGWVDGPLEDESRRIHPVFWVKAIVPELRPVVTT